MMKRSGPLFVSFLTALSEGAVGSGARILGAGVVVVVRGNHPLIR
jgi:hypothetical protein